MANKKTIFISLLFSVFFSLLLNTATYAAAKHSDLFDYLASEISKPQYAKIPQVKTQLRLFLNNKKHLNNIIRQGEPYLYYIFKEVSLRKMPSELMLLPLIESAYDPYAHSWVGAAGLWQFMPQTAKGLGIKQNWWYDGRRDIITSTEGALEYLNYLHKFFKGNWLLAIASYNCGEGTVKRAIKSNLARGKKTDFWNLDLPQETKDYVPRLLALSLILRNPSNYGVEVPEVKAKPYFSSVDVGEQIDLAHAAKLANISLNEMYQLNPGYSRWTTDPDGPHKLLLPVNKVNIFYDNFAKHTGKELPKNLPNFDNWIADKPKPVAILVANRDKNFHLPENGRLRTADKRNHNNGISTLNYQVQPGDTLNKIARNHQVSMGELRSVNMITADELFPGDVVFIPKKNSVKKKSISDQLLKKTKRYIVKSGDNLFSIATRYKVSPKAIMKANALANDRLSVNQTLFIPILS